MASFDHSCLFCNQKVSSRLFLTCKKCGFRSHQTCLPGYRASEAASQQRAMGRIPFECGTCAPASFVDPVPDASSVHAPVTAPYAGRPRKRPLVDGVGSAEKRAESSSNVSLNGITALGSNFYLDSNLISAVLTSAEFIGMLTSVVKDAVNAAISSAAKDAVNAAISSGSRPSLASVTSTIASLMPNESFSSCPAPQSISSLVVESPAPYEASEDFLSPAPCEGTEELLSSMNYQEQDLLSPASYEVPTERSLEVSLEPKLPTEPNWIIASRTSIRKRTLLFDGMGNRYGVFKQQKGSCIFRCTARVANSKCKIRVKQVVRPGINSSVDYQQEDFTFCGSIGHIHPPTGSSLERAIVARDVKEAAVDRPFDGTMGLIKNVLERVPMPGAHIPSVDNLRRAVCRAREAARRHRGMIPI